jgi:hypothetical protein
MFSTLTFADIRTVSLYRSFESDCFVCDATLKIIEYNQMGYKFKDGIITESEDGQLYYMIFESEVEQ